MGTHSSILAQKLLCTEERGGLQSTGSQRVAYYGVRVSARARARAHTHTKETKVKIREIPVLSGGLYQYVFCGIVIHRLHNPTVPLYRKSASL